MAFEMPDAPGAVPSLRSGRDRREFLKYLALSPAILSSGGLRRFLCEGGIREWQATAGLIQSPDEALNVFDFEGVAHQKVSQGHWAYMSSGVDGDVTLRANREGFDHVRLRPRRLRNVETIDTKLTLFGETFDHPIFACPTASQRAFHPDGELGVARVAKAKNMLQMLSSVTSTSVEEVNKALGRPVWYQLYAPAPWEACQKIIERVAASGCNVLVLTVDVNTGRNSETFLRLRPKDVTQCNGCHSGPNGGSYRELPMYAPVADIPGITRNHAGLDWAYADRIRQLWKGKFVLKGVLTREDARLAISHGFDAIQVSNHGGRATETGESTIETLPEIVAEVNKKVPILVDGGFRRGTDVFKALALGATAVGIGRPILWGLGAFGQAGVDRVAEIVQRELRLVMGNCGTAKLAEIGREFVSTPDWRG